MGGRHQSVPLVYFKQAVRPKKSGAGEWWFGLWWRVAVSDVAAGGADGDGILVSVVWGIVEAVSVVVCGVYCMCCLYCTGVGCGC